MPARRREPVWLLRTVVDAIHADQLREHGGLPGVRDDNVLESALARARQKWIYGEHEISVLAAAYGYGIVTSHPYRDGNKRIGFLAMVTFLGVNGRELHTADAEVVTTIVRLAAGRLPEGDLAQWIRGYLTSA